MAVFSLVNLILLAVAVNGLLRCHPVYKTRRSIQLHGLNGNLQSSFVVSELFSGPAAKYNGELISETLKVVERQPQVDPNYVYGDVSQGSTPILFVSLILVIALGAAIPYFLSIGESAQAQQRKREEENRIGDNLFAQKAREEKGEAKVKSNKKK